MGKFKNIVSQYEIRENFFLQRSKLVGISRSLHVQKGYNR